MNHLFLGITHHEFTPWFRTLAYGKSSDALTLKRLVNLTHVRKDRLETALQGVLKAGLFEATEHAIFETEYHVPDSFLSGSEPHFFFTRLHRRQPIKSRWIYGYQSRYLTNQDEAP